jgi:hypothetical protein
MSAVSWFKRRAVQREVDKLRERIEARRVAVAGQPATSVGTWFTGAGLSLASGFVTGVSTGIPPEFDRDSMLRVLMRASAAAIAAAAMFVDTHSPDAVPSGPVPSPAPDAASADTAACGCDGHVTRAELLDRLRRQSGGGDPAGSSA